MKTATLCYLKNNNQTLMLHRIKKSGDMHKGKYNGLGGKLEDGETPEECAIREVKEESGFEMINPKFKGILTFPNFSKNETWQVFVFTASEFNGNMIESDEGDLEWIDDKDLFDLNLWDGDRIFLKWLENKGFFSAKFNYVDGKLINYDVIFYK